MITFAVRAAGVQRGQQGGVVAGIALALELLAQAAAGEPRRVGLLPARVGRTDQPDPRRRRRT